MLNEMEIYKNAMRYTLGRDGIFDCEREFMDVYDIGSNQEGINLFGELYGKTMSLIEATVEKDKIEPTKTLAKQLFNQSKFKFEGILHGIGNDFFKKEHVCLDSYEKLTEIE